MREEYTPCLDTQWLNAVNLPSVINTFSITYVNRNGNRVMPCYASIYYFLKIFFESFWYPGAAWEINLGIAPFKIFSTMAAQGSTLYKKVAYNVIWILEIIQYTPRVLPVYICLPLNISAAEGLDVFYVRVHPGGHACACMYLRVCSCVYVTHCGVFPRDKTAAPGPLQPSPQANSD